MFERLLHGIIYFIMSSVSSNEGGTKRLASISTIKEGVVGVLDIFSGVLQAVGLALSRLLTSWMLITSVLLLVLCWGVCSTKLQR